MVGFGASFHGVDGLSFLPIIVGVIALLVVVIIAVVLLVVCRRRSTSSKAAAAAAVVVGGVSPGTAASSALLTGQRVSCGSSVMATPHQFDKRQLHQQYAELRERPAGVVTHRLARPAPSPSPPAPHHQPSTSTTTARSANVGSPFLSYSSMSNTPLPANAAVSQSPQLHHLQYQPQHAYQLQQQQQQPHLQYYERC